MSKDVRLAIQRLPKSGHDAIHHDKSGTNIIESHIHLLAAAPHTILRPYEQFHLHIDTEIPFALQYRHCYGSATADPFY